MKVIQIGRSSKNDIHINDGLVSRVHCQLIEDDHGNYRIYDLNSRNGTYVNGVRHQGEIRLNKSDIVRIGNTTLPWLAYFQNVRTEYGSAGDRSYTPEPEQRSGVFGLIAFILALTGFGTIFSIVFGAIGMGRNRKLKGFAITGLILGCIEVIAAIIIWIFVVAELTRSNYYQPYYYYY